MKKIVVLEPLGVSGQLVIDEINQISEDYEVVYYDNRNEDPKVILERVKEASIIVLSNMKLDAEILSQCENLEMVNVAFTGFDLVDIDYCQTNDIIVSNASGYATQGVVELVFGLLLDLYRQITTGDNYVRNQRTHHSLLGIEIEGKKFGIVGAGAIGSKVAQVANAFGAEVYVYNRSAVNIDNVTQVSLEELFETCDIISINLPLNDATRGLINKDLIDLMHEDSVLINTARGPIVDNDYLAEALINKKIAGAAVDVFDMEPPIPTDYKLLSAPNTIFTPHVAYYTQEAMIKRFAIVKDNLEAFIAGSPINKVY